MAGKAQDKISTTISSRHKGEPDSAPPIAYPKTFDQ